MATRPNVLQGSRRIRFSFTDTYMGRLFHPFGQQGNTIQTRSLKRQDVEKNCNRLDVMAIASGRGPYYGSYVQQRCNRPDAKATSSRRGLNMGMREAHYGKPVAQKTVQTLNASVRMPPREFRNRLDLGLLSL
jgi:hypothetical protein